MKDIFKLSEDGKTLLSFTDKGVTHVIIPYGVVTLKSDYSGNVKPNKSINAKKIDGAISMIQALGMYLETPHYANEILCF